jgi:hypothetical protein
MDRLDIAVSKQVDRMVGRYQTALLCGVAGLALAVAGSMYLSDPHALLYYGDSNYHLSVARKMFDWQNPDLDYIGKVWLPLPHLLLMFPSMSDALFYSGFAGTVINVPALALTTAILYKMLLATGRLDPRLATVAALLYPLNPNVMYLAITAMTEVTFMLFFVASAFYLQKWIRSSKSSSLLACAAFAAAATLCRYEAWPLTVFVVSAVLVSVVRKRLQWTRRVAAAALAVAGIALWLGWSAYSYGDHLTFANAEYYSAAFAATERPVRGTLYLQPLNVLGVYGITALVVYGPVMLWAGARGYTENIKRTGLLWYLALPAIFTIISMLAGVGEMSFWFNSRFIVFLAPVLVVSSFMYLQSAGRRQLYAAFALFFIHMLVMIPLLHSLTYFDSIRDSNTFPVPMSMKVGAGDFYLDEQGAVTVSEPLRQEYRYVIPEDVPLVGVVTLIDSLFSYKYPDNLAAIEAGEFLKSNYDYGKIMTLAGLGQGDVVMISSGIRLAQYDSMTESDTWKESFKEPWAHDRWLVMAKAPELNPMKAQQYWDRNRGELDQRYETVFENKHYEILRLR